MSGAMATSLFANVVLLILLMVGIALLVDSQARLESAKDVAASATEQVAYWKDRAEQLLDTALMQGGKADGPVMRPPKPGAKDPISQVLAGIAMTSIDSSKRT